jgi:hypothetical protein
MNRFQILKLPEDYVPCLSMKNLEGQRMIREYIKAARERDLYTDRILEILNHEQDRRP